jgi:hypothetical protein
VLRRISNRTEKKQEDGENYLIKSFIIFPLHRVFSGRLHQGEEEKLAQNLTQKT